MATICVFYASEDIEIANAFVAVLERKYRVEWDKLLGPGKFHTQMQPRIKGSNAAVTLWSRHSVVEKCVAHAEAIFARDCGVPVFHAVLDRSDLPIPFNNETRYDLTNWDYQVPSIGLAHLLELIDKEIGNLPERLLLGRRQVSLPCFFASISSHETQLTPLAALQAARVLEPPLVLVSAYDVRFQETDREELSDDLIRNVSDLRENGTIILMDSGNYEFSRKRCKNEVWTLELYHRVLGEANYDLAFSFDDPFDRAQESSSDSISDFVLGQVKRDQAASKCEVLPIVHAPGTLDQGFNVGILPQVFKRISELLRPTLIAIPERELGDGLGSKIQTIENIRSELNTLGWYQPIHLLGTGNPWSIALFAHAGADSFDGLEWLRTCVDRTDGRLYHYQQFDFLEWQHVLAVKHELFKVIFASESSDVKYNAKVAMHNLDYIAFEWMSTITRGRRNNDLRRIAHDLAGKLASSKYMTLFGRADC